MNGLWVEWTAIAASHAAGRGAAVQYLEWQSNRIFLIESFGLFWIFAELVILYAAIEAWRFLNAEPRPEPFRWSKSEAWRAAAWLAAFAAASALILGRHVLRMGPETLLESGAPLGNVTAIYLRRTHEHLVVWAAFIAVWVALEAVIVCYGWRCYRRLNQIVRQGNAPQ